MFGKRSEATALKPSAAPAAPSKESTKPSVEAEEIRTIVDEIIAIRNVRLSVAEQNQLITEICDDILGYGPLEPLLARDDIADIMVNGAKHVFIETNGKMVKTNIHFRRYGFW